MKHIQQTGSRSLIIHNDGMVERITNDGYHVAPSTSWRIVGAVRLNNFGAIAERFTLQDVLTKHIQWKYKNGKQRVHLVDLDHGTMRTWMNPPHNVY